MDVIYGLIKLKTLAATFLNPLESIRCMCVSRGVMYGVWCDSYLTHSQL